MNKPSANSRLTSFLRSAVLALTLAGLGGTALAQSGADAAYGNRVAAARALMAVLSRDGGSGAAETLTQADGWLREAEQRAAAGDAAGARGLADRAHDAVKATLVRLKGAPAGSVAANAAPANTNATADAATVERERTLAQREIATARVLLDAMRRDPATAREVPALAESVDGAQRQLDDGQMHAALTTIEATYGRAKGLLAATRTSDGRLSGSAALAADRASAAARTDTPDLRERLARREAAVQALLAALARISDGQPRYRTLHGDSAQALTLAGELARGGRYGEAIETLDRTYLLLKVGIGELRGGTEVTASKQFATAGEEYSYEQGRNTDYAQLIDSLIGDAQDLTDWRNAAGRARQLRLDADAAASAGDWLRAIRAIGDSTRALKNILRDAGFPIL